MVEQTMPAGIVKNTFLEFASSVPQSGTSRRSKSLGAYEGPQQALQFMQAQQGVSSEFQPYMCQRPGHLPMMQMSTQRQHACVQAGFHADA
eukprot:1288661-Amphidinium_carterae.1